MSNLIRKQYNSYFKNEPYVNDVPPDYTIYADDIVAKEDLPYPFVYYPGSGGTFVGFSKKDRQTIYFCSCAEKPIKKLLVNLLSGQFSRSGFQDFKEYLLRYNYFPKDFLFVLEKYNPRNLVDILNCFKYRNKICHECNKKIPSLLYGIKMDLPSKFKQQYGWYMNKKYYDLFGNKIYVWMDEKVFKSLPDEVKFQMKYISRQEWINANSNVKSGEYKETSTEYIQGDKIRQQVQKNSRIIQRYVENKTREAFGYKDIDDEWTSETILYHITKSLYPKMSLIRHYRPDYLQGMEFDIFIQELNVAVEYQGIQHYKPIDYFGGTKGFSELKIRDANKKNICKTLGISLVYIKYNDDLSYKLIKEKLNKKIDRKLTRL